MTTQTLASPSTITLEEIEAFTEGDCWLLAEALWMATGTWTLVAISACEENPVDEVLSSGIDWVHLAVRTPDGLIVDIEGVHTDLEAYFQRWMPVAEERYIEPFLDLYEIFDYEEYEDIVRDQSPVYEFDGDRIDAIVQELISRAAK